ncbi:Protein kinase and PP2C-like domain-containing protein [Linum perenne]
MGLEIVEPNSCIRGCCCSDSIPLHLPTSAYTLLSPIARGAESVVYEAILNGAKVAVKKPILSTSEHIDKFHKELQLLCTLNHPGISRDVKPANMLLDENLYPHLADFGLAEFKKNLAQVTVENWRSSGKPTGGFHKKNMVGTLIYMAPEVLKKEVHTEKSDVYSFGISINELLTGVVPYTDLRAEAQAHTVLEMNYTEQQLTAAVVSGKLRPALATSESGASPCLLSLIQRCWDDNPDRRPSFSDILLELDTMIGQKLVLEKYIDHTEKSTRNNQEAINWSHQGERVVKRTSFAGNSGLSSWFDSSTSFVEYYPVLSCGSFASRGRRETMEDTHFMMPNFCNEKSIHAFGIFDGHRGGAAAEFSAKALPGYLHNLGLTRSPIDALTKSFIETDVAFKNELDSHRSSRRITQKNWHPGCTAIASLIVGNRLFVANAGDCRAMLCRAGNAFPLTEDHIASNLKERERVVSAGGEVKWQVDTWRVGSAALQVTRSIGDDDLKPAVTAEPEVTETILTEEDEFLVMASDGLWDCVRNAEVVSIIRDTVKEPTMCSKRLATEAAERGSNDNITVIVVFLRPVSTAERVY